jgi:hypothetical protein
MTTIEQHHDPYSTFIFAMRSRHTREKYISRMKRFFNYIGLEGLLIEEQARAFTNSDICEYNILRFLQMLRQQVDNREIVSTTIWNYVAAIKLFCEMNDVDIKWKKITRGLPRGRKWARDRAPTIEEIKMLCEYPDRRIKPLVYTFVSSGIRLEAWDWFRWGHVTKLEGCARIRVYAGEPEEYFTYISNEAYDQLERWMNYRKISGEHITPQSWLMRKLWDATDTDRKGSATRPEKLTIAGLKTLLYHAYHAQKLRGSLEDGMRRYEFKGIHGFRKYFKTRAEQAMKPINVEILMAHSVGMSDSYYRPSEQDLLQDYLKAVPLLTIESQHIPSTDTQRIEKEIDELRVKISELTHMYLDSDQTKPTSVVFGEYQRNGGAKSADSATGSRSSGTAETY